MIKNGILGYVAKSTGGMKLQGDETWYNASKDYKSYVEENIDELTLWVGNPVKMALDDKGKVTRIDKETPPPKPAPGLSENNYKQETKNPIFSIGAEERRKVRGMCISYAKDLVNAQMVPYTKLEDAAQKMVDFIYKQE